MGEELTLLPLEFNGSIRIEARPERVTSETGVILLREAMDRLGIVRWLAARLYDPRDPALITHPLAELLHTAILLLAQGWRDEDDADALRDDPAMRLAVSTRRGVAPLEMRPRIEGVVLDRNPLHPDGLASQPTLSRLLSLVGAPANCAIMRMAILECAARRIQLMNGAKLKYGIIDVDSLPVEVEGHQPGSAHNGHYQARIYHPLVATMAQTGDLLDIRLRPGHVHTADGALNFILGLVDDAERALCDKAAVRFDAGFPSEDLLAGLEARGVDFLARLRNNPVLDRMAAPHLGAPPPRRPGDAPRTWFHEMTYEPASWSHARRVVLVVLERPEELFLHHFWIVTSWTAEQIRAQDLLDHYRQRGTAEGHMGELMDVLAPALSSAPRAKQHYRGEPLEPHYSECDAYGNNEARLVLNALAYNIMHVARLLLEQATGKGWSLRRVRERVLRIPARILLHGRRAIVAIAAYAAKTWSALLARLVHLRLVES
jgi:hypothetical protein